MLSSRAIAAVVRRAIELIEKQGFRRGKRGAGFCVGDAIAAADPKKKYRWTVFARAESVICATTTMRHTHWYGKRLIPRWNDRPGRTKKEAIALLRTVLANRTPFTYRDELGRMVGLADPRDDWYRRIGPADIIRMAKWVRR